MPRPVSLRAAAARTVTLRPQAAAAGLRQQCDYSPGLARGLGGRVRLRAAARRPGRPGGRALEMALTRKKLHSKIGNEAHKDEVLDVFRLLDTKGKGMLTEGEVKSALSWFGVVIKEWPEKSLYNEQDFLYLSERFLPDLVQSRSLTLLAAAYRRKYFFKVAETQLLQPIPTWPKHRPMSESETKYRSSHRDDAGLRFLYTPTIDSGLLCPPRIHRPHWLAFKKWLIYYQTYHQEKARRHPGSTDSLRVPKDVSSVLSESSASPLNKLELARKKWVSNRSVSESRIIAAAAGPSPPEIGELLQRLQQKRGESLRRAVQGCRVAGACDVMIMTPLGRRGQARAKKPSLSASKQAFLSKGLRLPMLHLT